MLDSAVAVVMREVLLRNVSRLRPRGTLRGFLRDSFLSVALYFSEIVTKMTSFELEETNIILTCLHIYYLQVCNLLVSFEMLCNHWIKKFILMHFEVLNL